MISQSVCKGKSLRHCWICSADGLKMDTLIPASAQGWICHLTCTLMDYLFSHDHRSRSPTPPTPISSSIVRNKDDTAPGSVWAPGLTVTPYLRAIPCRVSLSVTRCSTNFSPRDAVTLAVLPYERILVRAKLWDSSLSDSEPDLDRGKMGWPSRPPPSRIGRTGENSAIFPCINKEGGLRVFV